MTTVKYRDLSKKLIATIAQRDCAWEELRKIREVIQAAENESTYDEVVSLYNKWKNTKDKLASQEAIKTLFIIMNQRDEALSELQKISALLPIGTGKSIYVTLREVLCGR